LSAFGIQFLCNSRLSLIVAVVIIDVVLYTGDWHVDSRSYDHEPDTCSLTESLRMFADELCDV